MTILMTVLGFLIDIVEFVVLLGVLEVLFVIWLLLTPCRILVKRKVMLEPIKERRLSENAELRKKCQEQIDAFKKIEPFLDLKGSNWKD